MRGEKTQIFRTIECSLRNDCHFYTWYSSEHETFQNECLLFRSCDNVESCTQGCFSGSTNCDNSTTSTPITTSEVPNVCNDLDYLILFDPTRNSKHVSDSNFGLCDNFDSPYPSTDWKGPGWYRLIFMRVNYSFVIYAKFYCFLIPVFGM